MLVISSREFRAHQKSYLDKIDQGIEILIQRGKNRSYKLSAVEKDDTLMTKEEFFAKIDASLKEAEQGKVYELLPNESIDQFLARISEIIR